MAESVKVVVVDDDRNEGGALTDLLNQSHDELAVTLIIPSLDIAETASAAIEALVGDGPRLVLVDYRLGDNPISDERHADYKGGTVAELVRDREPDLPIALLTSEEKLHKWVERRTGTEELFDWTLIKNHVTRPGGAEQIGTQIVDFALSWERARDWEGTVLWERMAELLQAPDGEIALFQELEVDPPKADVPGEIMHWVLDRALRIPGPLIDGATTRVVLGLAPEAFATPEVSGWLEDARYTGALSTFEERWWGQLVRAKLADTARGTRPLNASERARALGDALGVQLAHEVCSWCAGERTLQACGLCGSATDAAHSVRPLARPLPAWADAWVVCFNCIAKGRADDVVFPQAVQEVIAALAEDRIRPPGE